MIRVLVFGLEALAAIGLALLGAACATSDADCGGSYRIGTGFSAEQIERMERAAGRWNVFAGPGTVRLAGDGECLIERATVPDHTADYGHVSGTIRVDPDFRCVSRPPLPCLEVAIAHEFGHSLGFGHLPLPSLMAEHDAVDDFTTIDRAECERLGVCRGRS